ncbi:ATP-binding protein, partial [Ferroplasma acidiphilum]
VINKSFNNTGEKIYIFLDEVQKLKDFENKIKIYYDLYPDIKFILSGSASISIRKISNESLAGRIISFYIEPLSFLEFLEMNNFNIEEIKHNYNLYKNEIMPMLDIYSKYGSFPELALSRDDDYARKYIKETVVERIIYKDIIEEFNVNDLTLLRSLINIIANKPEMILNFRSISENLGKDQRTISNYFEYLEYSFLIKIIYNYRENISITMRKLKKCYPIT